MSGSFPNNLQVALLYDATRPLDPVALGQAFCAAELADSQLRYNIIETAAGAHFRSFGANDVMVFIETIDRPADLALFRPALQSVFTRLATPNAEALLSRHRSHVLINVKHGALPNIPEVAAMMQKLGMPEPGHSLPDFLERQRVLSRLVTLAAAEARPTLAHWTGSDHLVTPDFLDAFAAEAAPGMLHVHPLPFRAEDAPDGRAQAGLDTHGATHFIGREIRILPNPVPWIVNFQSVLAFLRIATVRNGYVIPDGDTFGDESRTVSFRVRHIPAQTIDGREHPARYDLTLLLNREHGFQAPDYVSPATPAINTAAPPPELVDTDTPEGRRQVEEWAQKRAMAAGIGAQIEVRPTDDGPPPAFGRRPQQPTQR